VIEISMCMAVWMTSHLLKRSVQSYLRQDIDPSRWELIIMDDNSPDDVRAACAALEGSGLNYRIVRLDHSYGMRGNTVSFNTAFALALGHILAETTPETLLPHDGIRRLLEPHEAHPRAFVAMKTYNLTIPGQQAIDTVDWASDAMNCAGLPEWDSAWTQNNVRVKHFGTHQTCSIRKGVFYEVWKGRGFPLFGDYGSEDPAYSGRRPQQGVIDITLPNEHMAVHQWHPPFQYWMAKGHAPYLNRWAHSTSNYLNDTSGEVPAGGTCEIWDRGSHEKVPADERTYWKTFDATVIDLGVPANLTLDLLE
jgi:hypothetical protein